MNWDDVEHFKRVNKDLKTYFFNLELDELPKLKLIKSYVEYKNG